jgi:hypothetical protein
LGVFGDARIFGAFGSGSFRLQLRDESVDITEYPNLDDQITSEFKDGRAFVLNSSPRGRNPKNLTPVSASVNKLSERLIAFGNNIRDLVREIRERSLDKIDIFAKLAVASLRLAERPTKTQVFGENIGKDGFVEAIPQLVVKTLDQQPVSILAHWSLS